MKLGLQKYIEYWKNGLAKCEGLAAAFGPYVDYWTHVLAELDKPLLVTPPKLVEGCGHAMIGGSFKLKYCAEDVHP